MSLNRAIQRDLDSFFNKLDRSEYTIRKVSKGAFTQFEQLFNTIKDEFEMETYENPDESLFKFILYAGEKTKEDSIIYFCSMILATSLNHFEDAYRYSYDFAKKLTQIEPHNLDNWEWMLFFTNIPDKVVSKKALEDTIINTLRLDEQNIKALDILNKKFSQSKQSIMLGMFFEQITKIKGFKSTMIFYSEDSLLSSKSFGLVGLMIF
ncbi:MAG: hypothetical protein ACK5L5_00925 [Bacteroidales bacterium]